MILPVKDTQITYTSAVDRLVYCQNCGALLGSYIQINDHILFEVSSLLLSDAHGECVECGEKWHWSASEKKLADIIARCKK